MANLITWVEFIQQAVPVPFVEKGRTMEGWDCWGLVVCAYRHVMNIELPSFDNDYFSTRSYRTLMRLFGDGMEFVKPCPCRVGAVTLIYRRGHSIHCGIVAPQQMILHSEEFVGTVQQPFGEFRIEGFYEPR